MVGYYREGVVVGLKKRLGMGRCCVVVKVRRGKKKVQYSTRKVLYLPYRSVHGRVSEEDSWIPFPTRTSAKKGVITLTQLPQPRRVSSS